MLFSFFHPSPQGPCRVLAPSLQAQLRRSDAWLWSTGTAGDHKRLRNECVGGVEIRRLLPRPVGAPELSAKGLAGEGRMQEPRTEQLQLFRKCLPKRGWAKAGRE